MRILKIYFRVYYVQSVSKNKGFNTYVQIYKIMYVIMKLVINLLLLLTYSSLAYTINLDNNRTDPFKDIEDFMGIVYIKVGNTICSGTLINHRTVITAAHCLQEGKIAEIYTGDRVTGDSTPIETASFIKLPKGKRYSSFTGASYDIALISLKYPLVSIEPINLESTLPVLNTEVFISGFGLHGTGKQPDQEFDGKKRWGTNILSILSNEDDINGSSVDGSSDKIILGFDFDDNFGELESMISLGDSGSPLLIKTDNNYSVVGVASWIKKDNETLNRGYGSSAGYASIQQNLQWINETNPLRNVSSLKGGEWSLGSNWSDTAVPSNFIPLDLNYNFESAKYYSVNIHHSISLNKIIQIDELNITQRGNLSIKAKASLETLLDININSGSLKNENILKGNNLIVVDGIFENLNKTFVSNNINATNTLIFNQGIINANSILIDHGVVNGTGIFNSSEFLNKGTINPGSENNIFGTLTLETHLINKGTIELDISKNQSDNLILDELTLDGSLVLKANANLYSGNTFYSLFNFQKKNGLEFDTFEIDQTNLGRLRHELVYGDKSIGLNLLNPSYEDLGRNKKSKEIGKHIDLFTDNTSTEFQSILDQINYVSSDNQASEHIENLVLHNIYQPFIERIEINSNNNESGIFISDSKFQLKRTNIDYDSDIKRFNVNYLGINLSHLEIDSILINDNAREHSESSAYEIRIKVPIDILDFYFGLYEEDMDTKSSRVNDINLKQFFGSHNRSIDIEKQFLVLERNLTTKIGKVKAGIAYSTLEISTYPFKENYNGVSMAYNLNDIEINLTQPYIEFSKNLKFVKNKVSLGFGLRGSFFSSEKLSTEINLDNAATDLYLQDEIDLDENITANLYVSNVYNDSIYGKISYLRKGDNNALELKVGYLF